LCGQFGAGVDAELGEDVGEVHFDCAGGDEQAPGDGVVAQALGHEAGDLEFGGGEAGPAGCGPFAAAAFACEVGDRVVEGEPVALFPCLGEAVVSEGVPGLAGGAGGGSAVGGESGCQVPQPGPGGVGGGQEPGRIAVALAGTRQDAE
jgi:hypothetical protein